MKDSLKQAIQPTIEKTNTDWHLCRVQWLESIKNENTRRLYSRVSESFFLVTSWPVGTAAVTRWVKGLREAGLKKSTVNAYTAALSSFFGYAVGCGLVIKNPVEISSLRYKATRFKGKRILTRSEIKKLLGGINTQKPLGKRDFGLIVGFLLFGRQSPDWRLVQMSDFMFDGEHVFFGGEMIPAGLWSVLARYIQETGGRGPFDYLFLDRSGSHPITAQRLRAIVRRYADLGKFSTIRVMDLCHTAAELRQDGKQADSIFIGITN
ncbi:MAG: hypothetical protein CL609_23665 [Anaerolineaceae bacterium]|nr:hypothetical protein [Anaerolineaceae bacterium]